MNEKSRLFENGEKKTQTLEVEFGDLGGEVVDFIDPSSTVYLSKTDNSISSEYSVVIGSPFKFSDLRSLLGDLLGDKGIVLNTLLKDWSDDDLDASGLERKMIVEALSRDDTRFMDDVARRLRTFEEAKNELATDDVVASRWRGVFNDKKKDTDEFSRVDFAGRVRDLMWGLPETRRIPKAPKMGKRTRDYVAMGKFIQLRDSDRIGLINDAFHTFEDPVEAAVEQIQSEFNAYEVDTPKGLKGFLLKVDPSENVKSNFGGKQLEVGSNSGNLVVEYHDVKGRAFQITSANKNYLFPAISWKKMGENRQYNRNPNTLLPVGEILQYSTVNPNVVVKYPITKASLSRGLGLMLAVDVHRAKKEDSKFQSFETNTASELFYELQKDVNSSIIGAVENIL